MYWIVNVSLYHVFLSQKWSRIGLSHDLSHDFYSRWDPWNQIIIGLWFFFVALDKPSNISLWLSPSFQNHRVFRWSLTRCPTVSLSAFCHFILTYLEYIQFCRPSKSNNLHIYLLFRNNNKYIFTRQTTRQSTRQTRQTRQ